VGLGCAALARTVVTDQLEWGMTMRRQWIITMAAALAIAASSLASASDPRPIAPGLLLPGSFAGDLPAASGPGVRHQLDLWPDQLFQLRRTWLGRDGSRDMVGRWHVDPTRRALVLEGGETPPPQFEILGNGNLRLLDQQGQRIESSLPYDLTRADAFTPFEPTLELRGMFLYFADAARFTECRSGRNFPVAMEADFVALQRAYLEARQLPQTPVLATVEARIAARPKMEGEGTETSVVVDRFVAVHPGAACERAETAPSLRNTYWRIMRLRDVAIGEDQRRREPYLLLLADQPRFAGTVGCNQMLGGAEVSGEALRFRPGPSTMMACPPPLDAQERLFAEVLGAVASWRIDGRTLVLHDGAGRMVATFEAAYLP
jgi:heat shock protein HslJ